MQNGVSATMIQNTAASYNTEDGNMPRTGIEVNNEDRRQYGRFLHREPVVLVTIIGLSLLNGISKAGNSYFYGVSNWLMGLRIVFGVAELPGIIFAAFLSEVTGRKPVYIFLITLSILSSILSLLSRHDTILALVFISQGIIKGGTSVMNVVATSEYSSPKHRFAYMIAQLVACYLIGYAVPMKLLSTEVLSNPVYLQAFQVVLGLVCLGSACNWPESPYWLACRGRLEESRQAFLWLRGEQGRQELAAVLKARRRRGPTKLFWTSLAIAFTTMSMSIFSKIHDFRSFYDYHKYNFISYFIISCASVVVFSVIVVMSYLMKRKLMLVVVCGVSFILSYAIALWIYLKSDEKSDNVFLYIGYFVYDVIHRCGPATFGEVLFIEIVPYKYNTLVSCICYVCYFSIHALLVAFNYYELSLDTSVSMGLYTSCTLVCAILYYFFAPETKDKTLLGIHRTYSPEENDLNHEQNQIMMQNVYV